MTLTPNQKKWKKYIEEKLKKYRMGRIMRKNNELLALMIAATVKMYTDVNFNLSTMADSVKMVLDDPVFQRLATDPRAVVEYLQSPETVLKASHNMKHLFLESMEKSENWLKDNAEELGLENEDPQYVDLDDGTWLRMETSKTLGDDWMDVSKVREQERPEPTRRTVKEKPKTQTAIQEKKPSKPAKKDKNLIMLEEFNKALQEEPKQSQKQKPKPKPKPNPKPVVEEIVNELSANDWALTF